MPKLKKVVRRAVVAFSMRNRRKKAKAIVDFMEVNDVCNVIIMGCGGNAGKHFENARIVEMAVAEHAEIMLAVDSQQQNDLPWPFLRADGRDLPLDDNLTDMVLANAVIEHVGDGDDQKRFVAEQTRIGRSWVITTPNRWFPVESHTSTVLRHWSPAWREQHHQFSRLLSLTEFKDMLPPDARVVGRPWSATFTAFHLSGEAPDRAA